MITADPLRFFRLKPIQAARVSEISESTAAASVPSEEQINFHIGNPLQDDRLSALFMRIALGIDISRQDLRDDSLEDVLEFLGWDATDKPRLELLINLIRNSIPYMPRGGFNRAAPHALVRRFAAWLEKQQEPLLYNLGEKTGRREVILASGGIREALRVIFFSLSAYLQVIPARVCCYHFKLALPESSFPNLHFIQVDVDEQRAYEQIEQLANDSPEQPIIMIVGDLLGEEVRRNLRLLSIDASLFFIEINNAPNHLSLAREAKLVGRVIRLLSPAIFDERFDLLSPVFIAGNADFLKVIENLHFNLKGTPSASEVQLLSFLLENKPAKIRTTNGIYEFDPIVVHSDKHGNNPENALNRITQHISSQLDQALVSSATHVNSILLPLEGRISALTQIVAERYPIGLVDKLADVEPRELLSQLVENNNDHTWIQALQESFLAVFTRHQTQYRADHCIVVSGSSRTALGILGFNCGITDVVIPDLSWSYEQCFPNVHAVPLTDALELDVDGIIAEIQLLCADDPLWPQHGALVINNPHNATGRVFAEDSLRRLIAFCLDNNIYVIDDLAYQNVAPSDGMVDIKTVRQIANDLARSGKVFAARIDRVITVHAMSKTDCLAGARMAVVEILNEEIYGRFKIVNDEILPNLAAIFICYLFYRGSNEDTRAYWGLRNYLFKERTQALLSAMANLPSSRNPFGLDIMPPTGSMYPLLLIKNLPDGLSLDWLASSLARRGIGLLPLATFARTEKGFDTGRRAFRLTLGGPDGPEILLAKTRRLLIDLNRIIGEEKAHFNRKQLNYMNRAGNGELSGVQTDLWNKVSVQIHQTLSDSTVFTNYPSFGQVKGKDLFKRFSTEYLPERLELFHNRLIERASISNELVKRAEKDNGSWLENRLSKEFMKDSLVRRQGLFRARSYDRTVHPTQRYSLQSELAFDAILQTIIAGRTPEVQSINLAATELMREYLGLNVNIHAKDEATEILLDYSSLIEAEKYSELFSSTPISPFLSFWSDWDGSTRPSGQGHVLIAGLVMENVRQMAGIIHFIRQVDPQVAIPADLLQELEKLPQKSNRFSQVLNNITQLTQQLEGRYRGILPLSVEGNRFQQFATRIHLRRDPLRVLVQHNDRYEQKMLDLRRQRKELLESYFALNKRLRKQLYSMIPSVKENVSKTPLTRVVVDYRDILQRTAITPRINQATIAAKDQFTIDTTVFNVQEINSLTGKYSNPGMILGLQISFSSQPDALISLDRKLSIQAEKISRENPSIELPTIWLIPLFEDQKIVSEIPGFLNSVWDYATQSRRAEQTAQSRFAEILPEVFIAGSDLSQQISQAAGAHEYLKAKHSIYSWLAEHGVAETVRIKLGSGEAMQRQGGYYSPVAGKPAFPKYKEQKSRFARNLQAAAHKSTLYAMTPLQGVFMGGDLRTFQSCLSEQLRYLPVDEFANLLFHVQQTQREYRGELMRAVETLTESRMASQSRNIQELERLTVNTRDPVYEGFLGELTRHFRHILYGKEDDVAGIHIISYFIARSLPQLRDRPTSRPRLSSGASRGQQLLAYIADIIPLASHGSLLRAIAHNQAQTAILGINQLTTGLFRAVDYYFQSTQSSSESENVLAERILPFLPVYEILETLRLYQDRSGEYISRVEKAFPAGNSAFVALREDSDAMQRYLPLFQKELVRRHGLDANEFFPEGIFIQELLPTLRSDLAVLLQKDLFNIEPDMFFEKSSSRMDAAWMERCTRLLKIPQQIREWRALIWEILGESVFQRVQSFTELANALFSFSSIRSATASINPVQRPKLSPALNDFLRAAPADDEMRQFLLSAVEYLNTFTEGTIEIPVSILHALNDVERIAMIEESSLPKDKQELLRFATLQIARMAGDNG